MLLLTSPTENLGGTCPPAVVVVVVVVVFFFVGVCLFSLLVQMLFFLTITLD